MNVKVLIDQIVRQTTVLIAQLATAAGLRAPLAHIANQVFFNLVQELEGQGVGRKVIADMFGLALRSYQLKVHRLSESLTERNRSLWEAILDHLRSQGGMVQRTDVLRRFRNDDEAMVRGILRDLVTSGLVFETGHGRSAVYRAASDEELGQLAAGGDRAANAALVWIGVYRLGPIGFDELVAALGLPDEAVRAALDELVGEGRVEAESGGGGELAYRSDTCVLPLGSDHGWEAALFDHYQSLVTAIGLKLRQGQTESLPEDVIGGSTWSFDIWPDHPYEDEVLGLLRQTRRRVSALRRDVTTYNQASVRPRNGSGRVTFYAGQSYRRDEADDDAMD